MLAAEPGHLSLTPSMAQGNNGLHKLSSDLYRCALVYLSSPKLDDEVNIMELNKDDVMCVRT